MTERSCRHPIGLVRKGRAGDRRKVAVVDRERLRKSIVEAEVILVIKAHGFRTPDAAARLIGQVVVENEAVVRARRQRGVRIIEIGLPMSTGPRVIKVCVYAIVSAME